MLHGGANGLGSVSCPLLVVFITVAVAHVLSISFVRMYCIQRIRESSSMIFEHQTIPVDPSDGFCGHEESEGLGTGDRWHESAVEFGGRW